MEFRKPILWTGMLLLLMAAGFLLPQGDRMLVIGHPGMSERHMMSIVEAADGRLVAGTRLPWIVVAEGSSERFTLALWKAGALAVANDFIGYGCMRENDRG
ncbi:hypothetical protein [Gellertiella hungarica]|uniref:Uncharacterized protein n=1 Tax=Gellertiella hungarica TaxID=1572859 RepID=A0A7W6J380_9HYPH|nr:hypothetical protein [Gellertiella hungarica]MBB4063929.1 hypothetical protein [Gellertiella hungarica]